MTGYHEIDAPASAPVSEAPVDDNSNVSAFYPTIAKDDRPLIESDVQRHQRHDDTLIHTALGLRKAILPISIIITIPAITFVAGSMFMMGVINSSSIAAAGILAVILGGAWVGLFIACLSTIKDRFHHYGYTALPYFLVTLPALAVVVYTITPLLLARFDTLTFIAVLTGLLIVTSLVVSAIYIFLASVVVAARMRKQAATPPTRPLDNRGRV